MIASQHKIIRFFRGFTLIELMVVIAIVGILTAIALPSYTDYIRKSRRADGISALMAIQLNQEKWRANHTTYSSLLTDVWHDTTNTPPLSTDKHYSLTLALTGTGETGYVITAIPRVGDDQTKDKCKSFVLTITGGSPSDKDVSIDATETKDRCWQR